MCNVDLAVTVTMDRSLGWQLSVPVKVSVTLTCVVIVIGLAHAVPAAAKATKAASLNATMRRLTTPLLSYFFRLFRTEVSRDVSGRRGKPHNDHTSLPPPR